MNKQAKAKSQKPEDRRMMQGSGLERRLKIVFQLGRKPKKLCAPNISVYILAIVVVRKQLGRSLSA